MPTEKNGFHGNLDPRPPPSGLVCITRWRLAAWGSSSKTPPPSSSVGELLGRCKRMSLLTGRALAEHL